MLGEVEIEGGIGKDAAGGVELEVEVGEVPSAKEEDDGGEEEARGAEGDEDAIDQEEPRDGESDGGSEKGSTAGIHGHRVGSLNDGGRGSNGQMENERMNGFG